MLKNFGKFFIFTERVLAVLPCDSINAKKVRKAASFERKVIDLTYGKKARSAVIMDSGHVIITSKSVKEMIEKIWGKDSG